ncbi:MAG: phosphatase PAP2 family protein, partial [bacterium]|nr:phosphatase PAP2 family protein [bacterium]
MSTSATAGTKSWETASTVGAGLLVTTAIGLPLAKDDWEGAGQAALSVGVAGGSAYLLKSIIREDRPDHSDQRSFPSGHAALSFSSAATLQRRYGWEIGLPAQVLAAFVAVARV